MQHQNSVPPVGQHLYSSNVDPFQPKGASHAFLNAILATALFRCWHLILFFSAWAAAICLIADNVYNISVQTTLITVFGTVLGFVISYRTSSSFERYNEGRRYWSSIVYGSRTLARTIWFHVPYVDVPPERVEEIRSQTLIEKKSAINLIEAFAVAVKHYLRGEESIFYEDLYHLVRFLPTYILPAGRPSLSSPADPRNEEAQLRRLDTRQSQQTRANGGPPSPTKARKSNAPILQTTAPTPPETLLASKGKALAEIDLEKAMEGKDKDMLSPPYGADGFPPPLARAGTLLPARDPPKYALFDVFPFSLLVGWLLKRGKEVRGKKSAKIKARTGTVNHNIPLEITFYLSAYISELQRRKILDVPTCTTLINNLHLLIDSLTGLERILTTPIPFSYSIHLWVVTYIFVTLLPFQLWASMRWMTIPATGIASFVLFGFIVAGEEIENPFGYDKNDLNLDHFTHNIIRVELQALTSRPPPELRDWALNPENVYIFAGPSAGRDGTSPQEWMRRGETAMRETLSTMDGTFDPIVRR